MDDGKGLRAENAPDEAVFRFHRRYEPEDVISEIYNQTKVP